MKYAWQAFSAVALFSLLLLLPVAWLYIGDAQGAHTLGVWHSYTFMSSGQGRLIIISHAFRTGQFSPHLLTLAVIPILLPSAWLVGWAFKRQHAQQRARQGFPVDT